MLGRIGYEVERLWSCLPRKESGRDGRIYGKGRESYEQVELAALTLMLLVWVGSVLDHALHRLLAQSMTKGPFMPATRLALSLTDREDAAAFERVRQLQAELR